MVKTLLFHRAEPFNAKFNYLRLAEDPRIRKVILKARQVILLNCIHFKLAVVLMFNSPEEGKKIWEKRSKELFEADKVLDIEKDKA
jgi:hypothetical protein